MSYERPRIERRVKVMGPVIAGAAAPGSDFRIIATPKSTHSD